MKRLEVFEFFANTRKFDGFASDGLEAEGRATTRITIQFCEDGASNIQRLIEMRRDVDRLLPRGSIEHKQRFLRLNQVAESHKFLH